jgi:hypothetical protein
VDQKSIFLQQKQTLLGPISVLENPSIGRSEKAQACIVKGLFALINPNIQFRIQTCLDFNSKSKGFPNWV